MAARLAGLWLLVNVFPAFRVVEYARRLGRNRWLWFTVSLLLTPIPFLLAAARSRPPVNPGNAKGRPRPPGMTRCPHCRKLFDRQELTGSAPRCPLCRMPLPPETNA